MGIQLQRIRLADGHDAINGHGMIRVRIELCLHGLQVLPAEMALQDLKALVVSKTSGQVSGITQRHQVIAAMALVVIENHWGFPAWIVQEDPCARRAKALGQLDG